MSDGKKYGIGIDLGGTKLLLLITTPSGDIVYEAKIPAINTAPQIAQFTRESIAAAGLKTEDIIGLGIGIPGTVQNGVVNRARALGWYNVDLGRDLREALPFSVFIENDVNLAALGERWKGSGEQSPDIFFITIGTGVGGAIIAGGNLIKGYHYSSGEAGFFVERNDIENGLYNRLGEQGVLEKKISGTALGRHGCPAEELFVRYSRGDEKAVAVIDDFIIDLAVMIANCVNLLDPERVIIGGGVSNDLTPFLPKLSELVEQFSLVKTTIAIAALGAKAGAYGAIAFMLDDIDKNKFFITEEAK
jgi:glucokinase